MPLTADDLLGTAAAVAGRDAIQKRRISTVGRSGISKRKGSNSNDPITITVVVLLTALFFGLSYGWICMPARAIRKGVVRHSRAERTNLPVTF